MKLTRAIALCALTLAIALAIGAISPYQPYASAGTPDPIIIIATPRLDALPTPALAIAAPVAAPVEQPQPAAAPVEQPQPAAAPVEQLIPAEVPQLGSVEQPQPQVVYIEVPIASVEQLQQPAAPVEQLADLPTIQCPCGVIEPQAYEPMTEREQQYSRARTR